MLGEKLRHKTANSTNSHFYMEANFHFAQAETIIVGMRFCGKYGEKRDRTMIVNRFRDAAR
jgi:hypothetical protein